MNTVRLLITISFENLKIESCIRMIKKKSIKLITPHISLNSKDAWTIS